LVNDESANDHSLKLGSFRLPRRGGKDVLLTKIHKPAHGAAAKCKGRVLVMDDEEIIRSILCVMLLAFGYDAAVAVNGEQAIESYLDAMKSGAPFDVVIIDLNIPEGMGGKETIRRLIEIDPGVRAIVSSGFVDDPALLRFTEYGFKGALRKPYSISELRQVLQDVIFRDEFTEATGNLSA